MTLVSFQAALEHADEIELTTTGRVTGKPISCAIRSACCSLSITSSEPGTVDTFAAAARRLDSILSPMAAMARLLGPMKTMPACSSAAAKASRSDRKP